MQQCFSVGFTGRAVRRTGQLLTSMAVVATMWGCGDAASPVGPDGSVARGVGNSNAPGLNKVDTIADQYIVQFRDDVNDVPGLAKKLVADDSGELQHTYTKAIKGFSARLPQKALNGLRNNPHIESIEPDMIVSTVGTQTGATWGLDRIDQSALPLNGSYTYASTGSGVTAYIIDTGIRFDNQEFEGRAVSGFDYSGGTGADCNGHGTHVAGTVGGKTYGVAKQVQLVAVRVLDCSSSGSTSNVIAGLDWIARNVKLPAVANISLNGSLYSALNTAVESVIKAGVTVAVAAGNAGVDACTTSPASAVNALTVGASDASDSRASFSNWGTCLDIFAPGVSITAAAFSGSTAIATMSGTSMASPHVAGAAALYLESFPTSTPSQVRGALLAGASQGIVKLGQSTNNYLLNISSLPAPVPVPPVVNALPVADFAVSCTELTCTFTDRSSDSDGTLSLWSWTFGDGTTSAGRSPQKTFASAGTYQVSLSVTDNLGGRTTAAKSVTVTVSAVALDARLRKVKNTKFSDLTWSKATTSQVEIYRNNLLLTRVANSGAFSEQITAKGSGTYSYKVCETGGVVCSALRAVVY